VKDKMNCLLCDREKLIEESNYPYLVHEFEHSWWLLGEHQYYQGYSVLLLKGHAREMTDLKPELSSKVFQELLEAQKILTKAFNPKKMNLCSLGNVVDHVHWHLFPRYESDPHFKNPPWLQMQDFDTKKISPNEAAEIILFLKSFIR
jgi:diadenosine tetraphosphate (Ap4A) HIT family hydrolase